MVVYQYRPQIDWFICWCYISPNPNLHICTPSLIAYLWLSWQQKNRSREHTPPSSTPQPRHESGRGLVSLQRDAPQLHASLEIPAHRRVARTQTHARTHARRLQ